MEKAVSSLEDAVRLDPSFPAAYVSLADAYIRLANGSTIQTRAESVRRAREAAEQALRLMPNLAEAHLSLARVRQYFDWDWQGAEDGFKQAIRISPSSVDAAAYYALFLAAFERFDEALAQAERARALDPGRVLQSTSVAAILYYADRYRDALAEIDGALARDPDNVNTHFTRGLTLAALGRYDDAIVEIDRSVSGFREVGRLADLARVHALAGHRPQAESILAEMVAASSAGSRLSPDKEAFIQAALGECRTRV